MDIITNSLSEVQRQTIIMYYYDEMQLEDISQAMECPVKTVSSRLVSARDKIREAVLIYEKKHGDRLHAIAPVPILTMILRIEAQRTSVPHIPMEVFTQILIEAAAKATATGAAADSDRAPCHNDRGDRGYIFVGRIYRIA